MPLGSIIPPGEVLYEADRPECLWLRTGPQRLRIQYGYLKTLPDDYTGPRHTVTVRHLPPVEPGEDWYEWEERPGPELVSNATGPTDEIVVHVCYMDAK